MQLEAHDDRKSETIAIETDIGIEIIGRAPEAQDGRAPAIRRLRLGLIRISVPGLLVLELPWPDAFPWQNDLALFGFRYRDGKTWKLLRMRVVERHPAGDRHDDLRRVDIHLNPLFPTDSQRVSNAIRRLYGYF